MVNFSHIQIILNVGNGSYTVSMFFDCFWNTFSCFN
jgi:hypothetical protein